MTRYTEHPRKVYFIRPIGMQGPVKIGCSFSPDRRRDTLETWSPFPLEIVAEMEGSMDVERRIHSLFRDQHKSREWFDWSPNLQGVIDAVCEGTFDPASLPDPVPFPRHNKPRKGWSDVMRLRMSYFHRIRHAENRTGFRLPFHLRGLTGNVLDDPDRRAAVDAFLADPSTGDDPIQWRQKTLEMLAGNTSEWASNRRRQLASELAELADAA